MTASNPTAVFKVNEREVVMSEFAERIANEQEEAAEAAEAEAED